MHRPVIAPTPDSPASHAVGLDLDGTLTQPGPWLDGRIAPPQPGAIDALRLLAEHRAVFVFTARPRKWLPAVAEWVTEHSGLPTMVDTSRARAYWLTRGTVLITSTKLGAAAYVDDRAVHHAGDWTTTLAVLTRAIGLDPAAGTPTNP